MVRNPVKMLWAGAWFAALMPAFAQSNAVPHVYASGFMMVSTLGNSLYRTLDPKYQKVLDPNPVQVENMDAPVITPIAMQDGDKTLGEVSISAGYIDLLNHLAHAKAIDRIEPGYFAKYALNLARQSGGDTLPDPPNMIDNRYWTLAVMNDQIGYFNQMIGLTLALNLSHHYLGLYNRHGSQMMAGKLVAINNLLAPEEWDASVKAATLNALNCALGTDGPKALFEAIDQMPRRPAWTTFIAPPTADLKKVNQQLKKYEDDFFHGKLK